jgi:TonB-linked SusC/RagA family outer membrane protein
MLRKLHFTDLLILVCSLIITGSTFAQSDSLFRFNGSVISSETGSPLPDINISFTNSESKPLSTDSLGSFSAVLTKDNYEIVLSYPGFHTIKRWIDPGTMERLYRMTPEDIKSRFREIYLPAQTQSIYDVTGTPASLTYRDLEKSYAPSFEQNLQGKISGLHVTGRSGMPGEGSFMHIRGYNSLYSSGIPLLVVDGMIVRNTGFDHSIVNGFHNNPLSDINMSNISRITVLKDAAETAWYGIKGGNGVILIETDRPSTGKTTLDVDLTGGVTGFNRHIPLMSANLHKSYLMEQMYDAGMTIDEIYSSYPFMEESPDYLFYENYNNNTNWQDNVFRTGFLSEANLKVKGGDERAMYALSGGLLNHSGVVNNTDFKRFNFQFNSLVNVSAKIHIGINLRFTNSKSNTAESGSLYQTNPIYAGLIKAPFLAIYEQDQEGVNLPVTNDKDQFGFSNPYVLVHNVSATNNGIGFLGQSYLHYTINRKLTFKMTIGLNRDKTNERLFVPAWGIAPQGNGSADRSMKSKVDQYNCFLNEEYLSYENLFKNVHYLGIDAGARLLLNRVDQDFGMAQNSATDEFRNLNSGKNNEISFGGYERHSSWISYFASVRYKFKDRYLATLNISVDGSSRFGTETESGIRIFSHPFAVLPALGLTWRVSEEPLLKNIKWMDELKLRAGYGISGLDDFSDYLGISYYVSIPYYTITGFYMGGLANPKIKWEQIRKINAGIDLSLFGEKIIFSIDYFSNKTSDMITYRELQPYYGYDFLISNDGACINTGVDLDFYTSFRKNDFKWEVNLNYSRYRNKVLTLEQDKIITEFTGGEKITVTGQPLAMFYGYRSMGVFITQAEADAADLVDKTGRHFEGGDIHFADTDGNHIINEADKVIIGNPHPKFFGGIFNKFSYKSFTLSAQISYVIGNDVFNYMRSQIENMSGFQNQSTAVYNRWVSDGQKTDMPRSTYGDPLGNSRFSNRWLEDGSFIRLNNVTLSYTYPRNLLFVRDLTVFASGINLVTWSKYLGYDPEFSYIDGVLGQGVDYGKMPQSRIVIAGIKLGL